MSDRPRARSGGKCRNAAARKDRLTAEVRGPKWFDVKNERSRGYAGASETAARRRERDRSETEKEDAAGESGGSDRASERNDGSTTTEWGKTVDAR